jgi:RNA polymerase subunit RPABC4/transcription elongation factor Spt4
MPNAKFCGRCGNSTIDVAPLVQVEASSSRVCAACAGPLDDDAQFCPTCGAKSEDLDSLFVLEVVASLENIATPWGRTVISAEPLKNKIRRVELMVDEKGRFSPSDRQTLIQWLSEFIYLDSYMYGEVSLDGKPVWCAWHLIGGSVFPLAADHAEFVLVVYDSLLPSGITEVDPDQIGDAPRLWKSD